jgi:hypothetical protein
MLPQTIIAAPNFRPRKGLMESIFRRTLVDNSSNCRTASNTQTKAGERLIGAPRRPIQFRVWELNSPANDCLTGFFLNVVVMGTIEV